MVIVTGQHKWHWSPRAGPVGMEFKQLGCRHATLGEINDRVFVPFIPVRLMPKPVACATAGVITHTACCLPYKHVVIDKMAKFIFTPPKIQASQSL